MCNVSRGILDKGMALGRKEGMDDSTIAAIKKPKTVRFMKTNLNQ